MKPTLSEKERAALMMLGKKSPEDIQPFDGHIRGEIGRLSMTIEQGNQKIGALKADLAETETALTQDIGAFEATARTYLAYVGTANVTPSPSPQEAPSESEPESGTPAPALVETPQEAPEGAPDEGDTPEPEAD